MRSAEYEAAFYTSLTPQLAAVLRNWPSLRQTWGSPVATSGNGPVARQKERLFDDSAVQLRPLYPTLPPITNSPNLPTAIAPCILAISPAICALPSLAPGPSF